MNMFLVFILKLSAMNGVYVQYYPNSLRPIYINFHIIDVDVASMQCTIYSYSTPDTSLYKFKITEVSEDKVVCKNAGIELYKKNDEALSIKFMSDPEFGEVFYYKIPRKQFDKENNPILKSDKIYDINGYLFFLHEKSIEIPSGKYSISILSPILEVNGNCLEYFEYFPLSKSKGESYCED